MIRPRLRVLVWTAATVVLVVAAVLLWRGSDAAATSSTTARAAAPVTGSPGPALSPAWTASGSPQPDTVVEGDRVVVGTGHGVRALDPRTGREAWHYTRANARMCGVTTVDGVVVAVFEVPGERQRCDQMVALDVNTGLRTWTRNINLSTDARLTSTPRSVLAVNRTGVLVVDPTGDNIRWRYHAPARCTLSAVAGDTGIAVLQRCPGAAAQLRLLDAFSGTARWTRDLPGATPRLAGADALVSLVGDTSLELFSAQDGTPLPAVPLPAVPLAPGGDGVGESLTGGAVLVWAHGTLVSLDPGNGALRWQGPARGLPGAAVRTTVGPADAAVAVPEDGAFVLRDPVTGSERGRSTAVDVPAGGVATSIGDVVVLRLADRVIGYR